MLNLKKFRRGRRNSGVKHTTRSGVIISLLQPLRNYALFVSDVVGTICIVRRYLYKALSLQSYLVSPNFNNCDVPDDIRKFNAPKYLPSCKVPYSYAEDVIGAFGLLFIAIAVFLTI